MEAILVPIFICFGLPVGIVLIRSYYRFREKELEARERQQHLLPGGDREREKKAAELEARIQNLESIVCSVDFELNQRLNRLAAQASQNFGSFSNLAARSPDGGAAAGVLAEGPMQGPMQGSIQAGYGLGQLVPGQEVLARYTVERELGRGGMGAVYLARDAKLGERVALKTISSLTTTASGEPAELAGRIRREVQAARRITHPNVIRIHDLHEDGPLLFLSMEYIDGETLFARVKRLGPLPVGEARRLLGEVAAGVAAAHAAGVVHRDLKPHNVLLGEGGRVVKVIDFGIAQAAFAAGADKGATTGTGIIMGTPEYMAPEQIRGGRIDARTDVYGLGAVAYFALCGQAPFSGDTPIAVAFAQVQEPPRPPGELRPDLPADLSATLLRALAKEPRARHADATEWQRAIVSPIVSPA